MLSYAFGFMAGALTAISPCVLPVLPLIVGSAVQEHRHAPLAVAAGMILSFTLLGVFFATAGVTFGIDSESVRVIAAIAMTLFGVVLLFPALQTKLQSMFSPFAGAASDKLANGKFKGMKGQFALGGLFGAVWSPCVGPTLGATVGLASQSGGLLPATITMFMFGVGSAIPLVFIAYGSRKAFLSNRAKLLRFGNFTKPLMGGVFASAGTVVLFGLDKKIEAALLGITPEAWIELITRF